ncbi:hypothetical protein FAF44_00200 [Nonomuraea sp. MG754425]|uniref:hypothetical protein n=1 Tax=Nonomuraea sp. MG754425 TaxID=2570319 RepID=UPI001F36FDE2|nr:hypothetical protein [Nonomuraea sp. MG754425]MCF6466839.1 hypothetical protein [Nonomuraea sp. MG754425]
MKKIITALALAAMAVATTTTLAHPAQAASYTCSSHGINGTNQAWARCDIYSGKVRLVAGCAVGWAESPWFGRQNGVYMLTKGCWGWVNQYWWETDG